MHLHAGNHTDIPGYRWFGFNRLDIHVNASKPSEGAGVIFRKWLTEYFEIMVIDRTFDGIVGIQFKNVALILKSLCLQFCILVLSTA
jgi:hypothetical protein